MSVTGRTAMVSYIGLLAVGSLLILAANVFKAWTDKRAADEKRTAEEAAQKLAETHHQEMLAVVAAANSQREAYVRAYEELKTSGTTGSVSALQPAHELDLKAVDERLDI